MQRAAPFGWLWGELSGSAYTLGILCTLSRKTASAAGESGPAGWLAGATIGVQGGHCMLVAGVMVLAAPRGLTLFTAVWKNQRCKPGTPWEASHDS
jgi:hypothetical protein